MGQISQTAASILLPGAFGNRTALAGLTAINGTAATAARSDSAPAIDQSIVPNWTGNHTWANNAEARFGVNADLRIFSDGINPTIRADTGAIKIMNGAIQTAQFQPNAMFLGTGTTTTSNCSVDSANTNTCDFQMRQGSLLRWITRKDGSSETGGNAGSNYGLIARDDTGANIGTVHAVVRASGSHTIGLNANSKHSFNGTFRPQAFTVAGLPAGTQGDIAYVTDANAPAFLTAVAGGGAVRTPVFFNGAAWVAF